MSLAGSLLVTVPALQVATLGEVPLDEKIIGLGQGHGVSPSQRARQVSPGRLAMLGKGAVSLKSRRMGKKKQIWQERLANVLSRPSPLRHICP